MNENKNDPSRIQFGPEFPPLSYYEEENWEIMEYHLVEFYPNKWYDVILLSTETPNFLDYFSDCGDDPISLDLEWESELCLFQFCFKNKVVILRHPNGEGNKVLLNFLLTHNFYAKGINNDKKQLKRKFETDQIANNIEDIARTRLIPYNYSENFMSMVRQFSGEPTAEFKDIRITTSNWELPKLSKRQILYAAFDVVSLKECYPNYPPKKEITKNRSNNNNDTNNDGDEDDNSNKKPKRTRNSIFTSEMIQEHALNAKRALSSSPNAITSISSTPTILEKYKRNVKLKRSPAREITGFIVYGYNGPQNMYTIKNIFSNVKKQKEEITSENQDEEKFLNDNFSDIDFCSTFEDNLFISFYEIDDIEKLIEKLRGYGEKVIKLDSLCTIKNLNISAEESTDGDVLFVQNISDKLIKNFNDLLFCFGANHEITVFHDTDNVDNPLDYIRIEPREASSSFRIKLFLSRFEYEGKTPIVSEFPYFLPKIRINDIPSNYNEDNLRDIFKEAGNITKIEILRRRTNQDKQTAFITYQTTEEADKAVKLFNHMKVESEGNMQPNQDFESNMNLFLSSNLSSITMLNNELKVFRYSDEPHLRFMRRYELRDTRVNLFNSNSKDLEALYSKYGRIHHCFFDPFFNVGRVQFFDKKDTTIASKSEKCEMTEESRTIVIRDLSFETTDSEILELCSQFGTIVNLITRDINILMRFIIKEVSFSSNKAANKAKSYFSSIKMIHGGAIRVAVLNGGFSFAPDWKMRQRKHWVKFAGQKPDDEFFEKAQRNGKIVKIEYKVADTKIVVACPVSSLTKSIDNDNIPTTETSISHETTEANQQRTSSESEEESQSSNKTTNQNNDDSSNLQSQVAITPITVTKKQEFTFVMFKNFESTKAYGDTIYPTIEEFVEFLNPTELYIDKTLIRVECPADSSNGGETQNDNSENNPQQVLAAAFGERKPVQMAIVIDPIPDFVTRKGLVDYLGEFAENCPVFTSMSTRERTSDTPQETNIGDFFDEIQNETNETSNNNDNDHTSNNNITNNNQNDNYNSDRNNNNAGNIDNDADNDSDDEESEKDSNEEEEENENELDEDEDIGPMRRAVLVPISRTLTNKIYSMMNDRKYTSGEVSELLKPVRMRLENVPNAPKVKPKEKIIIKQESKKMTIVVDPLPPRMTISDIEGLCGNFGKYSLTITGSAIVEGRKRALIHPLSCRAKKHIFRSLSIVFDGEEIVPVRIFPKDIPPPIRSSQTKTDASSDCNSTSVSV
ncbi:hypothetical protein M9Y10_029530 [Tritrichomonas musculus]|uniref:RRM domain-containing protein n=1 Tax=Tritrichomonas musculus TaxID=1915356 RepID=A0ABR2KMD9_9EUKA